MITALAPIFAGELAAYGEKLVGEDDERDFVAGADLADPRVLGPLIERFSAQYEIADPDLRAVASMWSKWHFSTLIPPALIANLLADRALPVSIGEVGIVPGPDGRTVAIRLRDAGRPLESVAAFDRFDSLIRGHVEPVIKTLCALSGVTPRVLWSNVGNLIENLVRRMEVAVGPGHSGVAAGNALLASRLDAVGRPNPLFEPVRYLKIDGRPVRKRRVCCIRYFLPKLDYCSTCPLVKTVKAANSSA